MSLQSVLQSGRRAAEARMTSACRVRRSTGEFTEDPDGFEVPAWSTPHMSLPVRIGGSERSRTVRVGDSEVEVAVRVAHFPADTTGLRDGDLIEITYGEQMGAVFELVEVSGGDQQTALRVPVVETQRPVEWS